MTDIVAGSSDFKGTDYTDMVNNDKQKLLCLLKILWTRTDKQHILNSQDLIRILQDEYQCSCDRRTIYSNVDALIHAGFKIKQVKGNTHGYYMEERIFSLPELKLLVDAVQSSKFITRSKTDQLIKKLEGLAGVENAARLQRQVYVHNRAKTDNERVYTNVDIIHSSIAENKKICFQYCAWNVKKQLVPKKNGDMYEVSPWCLTWDDENYYLVAYEDASDSIRHYRVDKMLNMHQVVMARTGRKNFEDFDLAMFSKKTFGMFSGTDERIILKCSNDLVGVIIDRFGKDVMIMQVDDQHFLTHVNVTVSPQFFGWLTALGVAVEIISPSHVRESYRTYINRIAEKYNQTLDHRGPK